MFTLTLTNGYPSPYPENLSEKEQEEISENVTSIEVHGVVNFQWLHTITIEFADRSYYDRARLVLGWTRWGELVLEAQNSPGEGYAHPAIIAGIDDEKKAYCGFILTPQEGDEPPPLSRVEFVALAREHAQNEWAYGALVDDHEDRVDAAMEAGETPEDFIDALGVKYDLIRASDW